MNATIRFLRVCWYELRQILQAWRSGEGDLVGLLIAWWQVVSGRVAVG